ncbi:disease resistance protein RPM1-like [Primulina huaijiensis]|uniref:disease resistance protein RPM1-like n=1 Tax=Primulina huaijiensis TaxID=1492673 RepID=UPI003CC70F0A
MAESAASFLVNKLDILLLQEQELLRGIGKNAVYIRDELGQMRAFLRAADAKEETDEQLKEWIKQVREITHDTEDVLEMYMLRFAYQRRDTSVLNWYIKKMYASLKNFRARHRIASEFQEIRLRLENVSKSRERFKDVHDGMNERSINKTYDTRGDALLLEEAEVVGIEKPKKQLLDWLMESDDGLKVISVVGMGGLGKTTLVKKIYDDSSVKANFNTHVWITVSENFNLELLLRNMIKHLANEIKLLPPQSLQEMTGDEMKEYVSNFLKDKTYVIVLDDVWKVDAWKSIRYAFPRMSARGRIIITTRFHDVGNVARCETNGHLYHLNPLTAEKSEELFYRKAFPRSSCPPYLNEISKSILKRCEGLPLALVVIGGLLATKNNNLEDWKMFEHNIGLESQEDSLKGMNKLLSLSYYDLPYYLKACFLYLSIFPEDELLLKWKIIRLWIAEGFVEVKDGKTQEEVAESYLNELLNRSLIQVAYTYRDGRPSKFRIHDILRNYIISKSIEHNLLIVPCGEEVNYPDKIRRMAVDTTFNDTKECCNVQYLRSLFWLEFVDSKSGLVFQKVFGGRCRLLKVLDVRGAPIDSIPSEVFKLYNLKYLCLKRTNIKLIPKSIGNLRNLETLDLKKSKVTELPVDILKLHKLRHLLVYSYGYVDAFHSTTRTLKAPYEIGRYLTSLQKLWEIDADEADGIKIVREIGKLTQLRRLGITKLRREDGMDLCLSLGKLINLRSLSIQSIDEDEVMDLDNSLSSSPLPFLRKVLLKGRLEKFPQWVYSLDGLTELHFEWSRLREDPLQNLEVLPNLVFLRIGRLSYEGEELIFKDRKFQKLEKLILQRLRGLRRVRVEKGSMSHLVEMIFEECKLMEELPEGMEHLRNLQYVDFSEMSEKFIGRLTRQKYKGGLEWKLAHVSKVEVWNRVNYEWKLQQF